MRNAALVMGRICATPEGRDAAVAARVPEVLAGVLTNDIPLAHAAWALCNLCFDVAHVPAVVFAGVMD